jgi:hypothetical protein
MPDSARNHGPIHDRPGEERLDWSAFSLRSFPSRRRHDFEALEAYEAYRNMLEQGTAQQRPSTHRALPGRRDDLSRSRPAAARAGARVAVAASSAGVLTRGPGGASAERPAG